MENLFEILYALSSFLNTHYFLSALFFILFLYIYAVLSLPGIIIVWLFSGYIFGNYIGYFVSILLTCLGSLTLFILSQTILHNFFHNIFSTHIKRIENIIKNNSYEILILFRIIPINIPFFLQNVGLSFFNISYYKFLITTFIGLTPITLMCAIIGKKINQITELKDFSLKNILTGELIIIILIILIIIIISVIYKRIKKDNI